MQFSNKPHLCFFKNGYLSRICLTLKAFVAISMCLCGNVRVISSDTEAMLGCFLLLASFRNLKRIINNDHCPASKTKIYEFT